MLLVGRVEALALAVIIRIICTTVVCPDIAVNLLVLLFTKWETARDDLRL
jgi:hypothetical protein